MYFFIFLILFLSLIVYALFNEYAVVNVQFNSNENRFLHVLFFWFYPLLKVNVQVESVPLVSVYFFKIRVYSKALKATGKKQFSLKDFPALALQKTYANIYYGLTNPFKTGIANGIISVIQSFVPDISIIQSPDYIPDNEYVIVTAGTEINLGRTAVNFIKMRKNKRRKNYGTV